MINHQTESQPASVFKNNTFIFWLIILIVAFLLTGHPPFIKQETGSEGVELIEGLGKASPARRIGLIAIGFIGIVSYFRSKLYTLYINGMLGWLIIFLFSWSLLSITWSDNVSLAVQKSVAFYLLCIGSVAVARAFSIKELINLAFWGCGTTLLLSIFAYIVRGDFNILDPNFRLAGMLYPNSQGMNTAVLLFSAIILYLSEIPRRKPYVIIIFIAVICLILTKSRTSLMSALFAILFCWMFIPGRFPKFLYFLLAIWIGCLLYFILGDELTIYGSKILLLGREDEYTSSMSNRVPLWNETFYYIAKNPLLGYGFGAFWTAERTADIMTSAWAAHHAHSEYIQMILSLGFIGLITYVLILMVSTKRALHMFIKSDDIYPAFYFLMIVWLSLNGLLESFVTSEAMFPNFIAIAVIIKLGLINERKELVIN